LKLKQENIQESEMIRIPVRSKAFVGCVVPKGAAICEIRLGTIVKKFLNIPCKHLHLK
jgi:hypothetical protein